MHMIHSCLLVPQSTFWGESFSLWTFGASSWVGQSDPSTLGQATGARLWFSVNEDVPIRVWRTVWKVSELPTTGGGLLKGGWTPSSHELLKNKVFHSWPYWRFGLSHSLSCALCVEEQQPWPSATKGQWHPLSQRPQSKMCPYVE